MWRRHWSIGVVGLEIESQQKEDIFFMYVHQWTHTLKYLMIGVAFPRFYPHSLEISNFNSEGKCVRYSVLPPLFIRTWFILQAEDSPLYVMVHFAQSQQSDIAVRFILPKEMAYFGPQVLLRKETSLYWGGDSILALSQCQHSHSKHRTQNEVVSTDKRAFIFFFSFFFFLKQPRRPKHYQSHPQAHVRIFHQWMSVNQRIEEKQKFLSSAETFYFFL